MASRFELSAAEIREITGWPDSMVDDYLSMAEAIKDLQTDAGSVRGVVSSAGSVVAGSGFSAARTATGTYSITFSVKKANANYVALPVAATDGYIATYASKTTSGFSVRITDSAGALSDSEFNFRVKPL